MNTVVPLPVKPRPPRHRPLVCQGVYGRPGGQGLDSLARLLLALAADASQPISPTGKPCQPGMLAIAWGGGEASRLICPCEHW